jgi:hypothetical protein
MAYAHFEDHNEIIISPEIGTNPSNLIDLINGSLIRYQLRIHDAHLQDGSSGSGGDEELQLLNERSQLIKSQEIRKITSTTLTSKEIQLKTLTILQQTLSALEQQITRGSDRGRGEGEEEEEVIREMIVKYNQLFQTDLSSSSTSSTSPIVTLPGTTSSYGT